MARRYFGNIRRLPSERYQASYKAPDGKRHAAPSTFGSRQGLGQPSRQDGRGPRRRDQAGNRHPMI